jgi:hypothetical protein
VARCSLSWVFLQTSHFDHELAVVLRVMWKRDRRINSSSYRHLCLGGDRPSQQLRAKRPLYQSSIVAQSKNRRPVSSQTPIIEDRIHANTSGYHLTASISTAYSSTTRMPKEAGTRGPMSKSSKSESLAHSSIPNIPKKRKTSPQPKFYAVKAGRTPGVYLTYKECERNITGFKNAACRYFR